MNLDRWMLSTRMLRAAEDGTGAAAPAATEAAAAPAASEAPAAPASPLATADSAKRDGAPAPAESASPDATKTPDKSGDAPPPGGAEAKPAEVAGDKKPEAGADEGKKPDVAKPEEGKAEGADAAADKPKEGDKTDVKPGEEAPLPKPAYEAYKLPENFKLDDTKLAQFNDILAETELSGKADHAVMQQMGQKLMDLYANEAQRIANDFRQYQVDVWNRHLESEVSSLKADPQLGGNRIDTSLGNAKYVLEQFGGSKEEQTRFMEKLDRSGISSSIEFVSLLNRMHERYREPQPVSPNLPSQKTNTGPGARGWYDSVDVGKA